MNDKKIFKKITRANSKFMYHYIRKELITRVLSNARNKAIDSICAFNEWVKDFRVIRK